MLENTQVGEMTEKQEAYLSALLDTRVCPAQIQGELDFLKALSVKPDKATASKYITALQGAPYKPKAYGDTPAIHTTVSVSPAFTPAPSTYVPASVSGGAHVTVQPYGAAAPAVTVQPAASKSKWQQWQDMAPGYYTVKGDSYAFHGTDVAVYLISMRKRKYGGPEKICRRLWKSYDGKPKWQTLNYVTAVNRIGEAGTVGIDVIAKLGLQVGFCCCCLRTLTDPFSVANGIGPVCAKTWGYSPAAQLTY